MNELSAGRQVDIAIIIRTALDPRRRDLIVRAIDSILGQEGVRARPIILANGGRFDPGLFDGLSRRTDLDFFYVEKISLPQAILLGRQKVSAPFFGFLDDDDYYLPGALRARWLRMQRDDAPDAVVSTGIRMDGSQPSPSGESIAQAKLGKEAALRALLDDSWLTSASGLYRTSTVDSRILNGAPVHEWTFLACRLVLEASVVFLEEPDHFINDSPVSESKSVEFDLSTVDAVERILELDLPEGVRPFAERKLAAALHFASAKHLARGDVAQAWRFHGRSLRARGGLRYLSYTRRLFVPLLASAA